jgi:hypothetical protein
MKRINIDISIALLVSVVFAADMRVNATVLPPELPHSFESANGYLAEWGLTSDGLLAVRLSAETTGWVGIGFSQDRSMPQSDIIVGAAAPDGSFSFVHDRFATARAEPAIDTQQDIEVLSATHVDGVTSIEFLRPLTTTDTRSDFDLALGSYFMLYAWGGRAVSNGRITQHPSDSRFVSAQPFDFTTAQIIPNYPPPPAPQLQAGDADQDLDFDQFDLIKVQIAAKYLTGQPATWGEGDWNSAPAGGQGAPPPGDGRFNQFDIIAAQQANIYLRGPYAALSPSGRQGDAQTSIIYDAGTGQVSVDAPVGIELTSINIDSAARIFTGAPAQNLGGSFDNDSNTNIFKATFGSSFGSLSFGNVAQAGLSEEFVLNDLAVVGSLAGGGALGHVDLVYVPEPTSLVLLALGIALGLIPISTVRLRAQP